MSTEIFDWNMVIRRFFQSFEATFATSKKAHFDCVPQHLRVVDGARTRWSTLILLDAVIYLLQFQEFNSTSRRAFNQQQVLYQCIVEEMQRSCPILYDSHMSSSQQHSTALLMASLITPWTTGAELKKHIMSDPTSKSRDKFLGIIESLFHHSAMPLLENDLTAVFRKVVLKVAHVFRGTHYTLPSRALHAAGSISSLQLSSKKIEGTKKRRQPPVDHEEYLDEVDAVNIYGTNSAIGEEAKMNIALLGQPPRKMRYLTRSTADRIRPNTSPTATVNETTYQCRYMIEQRVVHHHIPTEHVADDQLVSSTSPMYKIQSGDLIDQCLFDPSIFDDSFETDVAQPWDILDDWACEYRTGPTVRSFAPLSGLRPLSSTSAKLNSQSTSSNPLDCTAPQERNAASEPSQLPLVATSAPNDLSQSFDVVQHMYFLGGALHFPDNTVLSTYAHRTAFTGRSAPQNALHSTSPDTPSPLMMVVHPDDTTCTTSSEARAFSGVSSVTEDSHCGGNDESHMDDIVSVGLHENSNANAISHLEEELKSSCDIAEEVTTASRWCLLEEGVPLFSDNFGTHL